MRTSATAIAANEPAALEALHELGMTDGFPVVIPTRERVEPMILASGYDGDLSLGTVGPSQRAATIETVAVNAVMAGCLPEHFPAVAAAVRAICDPEFDLTEVQVTTHAVTPLIIINGPARGICGVASGYGAFGYGFRANMTIGRAVRLVMINVGGAKPGVSDMAVFGHPAKITFCAGENEEESPWEPLHVALGWRPEQSTATVIAVEGPHSVVVGYPMEGRDAEFAEKALDQIARSVGGLVSNSTFFPKGTIAVGINPHVAGLIARAGYSRRRVQEELVTRSRRPISELRRSMPEIMKPGNDDGIIKRSPDSILVFVVGGEGAYAIVCPTLSVGPHTNPIVTKEIEIAQACELPMSHA